MKPLVFSFALILFLLLFLPQIILGEVSCTPLLQKECRGVCIPSKDLCLNLDYPKFGGFNINDPAQQSLTGIVAWLYVFFVGISGLAAFVMIVWGGVQWMSSQGNPIATGDAKDKIKMALLGLLLVLASFLILQIINPELTLLKDPFQ